jgi:hypothetical protein
MKSYTEKPAAASLDFLARLSAAARRQLAREGVDLERLQGELERRAGEVLVLDVARLGLEQLPDVSPPGPGSRIERRITARLERRPCKRLAPRGQKKRDEDRDRRYLQRLERRLQGAYGQPDARLPAPVLIPAHVWRAASQIVADASGRAAAYHLGHHPNQIACQMIRRAALCRLPAGENKFTWSHPRARAIAALGVAMLSIAAPTRRLGPWNRIIRGIPRGAFAALLRDPFSGRRPAISTLAGRYRTGDDTAVGYMVALQTEGLFYSQQLPPSAADPCELMGPSGFATARYWMVSADPLRRVTAEERFRALELLQTELEVRRATYRNHYAAHTACDAPEREQPEQPATGPP